jgi:hypothetical protein
MSLKLRARAPPIFLPVVTFGLAANHRCDDMTYESMLYIRTYTLP